MRTNGGRLVIILASVAVLVTAATADAAPVGECGQFSVIHGSPARILNLTTSNVSCSGARRIAVQVTARYPYPRYWAGFTCRSYSYNDDHNFDIRCVSGTEVIHWHGGD